MQKLQKMLNPADGRENASSAEVRNNSQILAESLLLMAENDLESFIVTDNRNDQEVEARSERNFDEIQKFINDLERDIAATSTETVKAKLVKDYPGKLNSKRDKIADFCKRKFVDFTKEKLLRRISRSGGKSANEKLVGDIIELVKFCLSREITDEFKDMFKKSSASCESASANSQDSRTQDSSEIDKFIAMAENLDIKLTKQREDFDQLVSSLVKEVSELKSNLGEKQAKIRALESELATFKGNYKSAIENTKGKLESCEIEQNKHAENLKIHDCNIQKLFKDLDKYRKETKATSKKQSISKGPLATTSECESSLCEANANANAIVNNANSCAENNSLASKSNSNDNTLSQKSSNQLQKSQAEPHCTDEHENSNISETAKNQASTNGSESNFIGVEKHRIKRLYLGGVHEGVNEQLIVNHMEKKGISPTFVRLLKAMRNHIGMTVQLTLTTTQYFHQPK